jgi:glutaredoxin
MWFKMNGNLSGEKIPKRLSVNPVSILEYPDWSVMDHYMIFGKDDCPHTKKAVEAFKKQHKSFAYVNVDKDPQGLKKLLEYSNDQYVVPVIVNVTEDSVEIGYTGE